MSDESGSICFVVMGFGKKTALSKENKARVLDLDATYESIIEPAVTDAGLRCIRADNMLNSGMIDTRMYEMLLRADLVIADISTGNVNAVYELGVRHALRPHTTILMQEQEAAFHFDLSHVSTFRYVHMGDDIGSREAAKKKEELQTLINELMDTPTRDSPVYEFLRDLQPPALPDEAYRNLLTVIEERGDRLGNSIRRGKEAMKRDDFEAAIKNFDAARAIMTRKPADTEDSVGQSELSFVIQQLSLATYKSKQPTKLAALEEGLKIIEQLHPDGSFDIETLGIAGAIRKRLWEETDQREHLDKAIEYYGQGFLLHKDYYNGENYALCLDMRSELQADHQDAVYDAMTATKVRNDIIRLLEIEFVSPDYDDRIDRLWMNASMANSLIGVGLLTDAQPYEDQFKDLADAEWQIDTYEKNKAHMLAIRSDRSKPENA